MGTRTLISQRALLLIAALLAVFSFPRLGDAASLLAYEPDTPWQIVLAQRALSDSITPPSAIEPSIPAIPSATQDVDQRVHKSTGKAFLLNLAMPGTGHLYAGEKRGFVNLGLEGVAWAAYLYYHDRGKSKEREYQTYADGHWDYATWKANEQANGTYNAGADSLIVYFREHNTQQYYEDIGKISTYWSGWDSDENRNFYRGIRAHSNNFLKNAHTAVAGAFVNRVVSAVDVLRLLKQRGRASLGDDTQIRFKMRTKPFARENAFGFVITKRLD
jgi:hypothetical protein